MDTWPGSLPKFDAANYVLTLGDNLLRSQMDSGRSRVRRSTTFTPTMLSCQWVMTHAELRTFRAFYHDTIADGTQSFNIPIYGAASGADASGYKSHEARFSAPYSASYRTPATWTVNAQLEILEDIPNA